MRWGERGRRSGWGGEGVSLRELIVVRKRLDSHVGISIPIGIRGSIIGHALNHPRRILAEREQREPKCRIQPEDLIDIVRHVN